MTTGMTKSKITISVDPEKIAEIRRITGAESVSGAIDLALDQVIRRVRTLGDIAAYQAMPATADEIAWASFRVPADDIDDDTDWDAMFPETAR